MSGSVWELPSSDLRCGSYRPGHDIHWIHFKKATFEPGERIPVTARVDDDGLVHIEGDGLSLVRWHHRPAAVRAALDRFGGMALWKPRWHLLAVPTDSFMGSARSVFSLATLEQRQDCRAPVVRVAETPVDPEARNAELRAMDYSHIPPLRISPRYAEGRPRRRT